MLRESNCRLRAELQRLADCGVGLDLELLCPITK